MNDDSKTLYLLGGLTSVIGGLMMLFTCYWFTFRPVETYPIMHGVGVVIVILIVPTIIATTLLLINDARMGVLLGVGFAILWIVLELLTHCSQTAPLKTIYQLIGDEATKEQGNIVSIVWKEWVEGLNLIGAFLYSVSALCFGFSLRKWGNMASGVFLILSAIVFGITFIPNVSFYWHILSRALAFIFLGGVLMLATRGVVEEEWDV